MSHWRASTQLWLLVGTLCALLWGVGALALHAPAPTEAAANGSDAHGLPRAALIATLTLASLLGFALTRAWLRALRRQLGAEPAEAAALAQHIAAGSVHEALALREADAHSVVAALQRLQFSRRQHNQQLRVHAEGLASASLRLAQGSEQLCTRTQARCGALQQAAAALGALDASVRDDAAKVQQASRAALAASGVAQQGGQVVGQVVDTMRTIDAASKRIADIVGVIDGIAFQTNILALNAAVEAARAGEQGRGFAVVAAEVRSLARRSADAAREIKQLIGSSVERVELGTALADQAGATMAEVVAAIRRVSDTMSEISATRSEHGAGMARVGEAVQQLDQAARADAATVERGVALAQQLQQSCAQLQHTLAPGEAAPPTPALQAAQRASPPLRPASRVPPPPRAEAGEHGELIRA